MGVVNFRRAFVGLGTSENSSATRLVPLWAKCLFLVSIAFILAGLLLPAILVGSSAPGVGGALNIPTAAATALTGDEKADGSLSTADAPVIVRLSPTMFRIGFGFFVGFLFSYALRSYLSTAIIALAFFFVTGFGLQHEGLVEIKWTRLDEKRVEVGESISNSAKKASEKSDELLRYLPSASAAVIGLAAGFMRRRA